MSRGQPHPAPRRDDTGRVLVSRRLVAHIGQRHVNFVRRVCTVQAWCEVASDVATRNALLDLDVAERVLAEHARRNTLVPLDE